MNIAQHRLRNILAVVASLCVMAGCLSKEESDQGAATNTPGAGGGNTGGGNSAPSISGAPSQVVVVGNTYAFTPQATDADGDTLTFSIQNQPAWATFSATNGTVTGSPTIGDIGAYQNVVITVSDGQISSSLPAFSVDVSQVALGSASLSWTAPTNNSDGSNLNNLAGYRFYYGLDANNLTTFVEVADPTLTTYTVDNLVPGSYFFGTTAFNVDGIESSMSNIASKVVN